MAKKTYDDWLETVKKAERSLWQAPKNMRTAELCLAAVQQDGEALAYVPESLKAQVKK